MSTGARVELRDWGWRHGSRRRAALAGVDLRIEPGERVLLLGPSGAGKSTLLAGLAGVLGGPDDGEQTGTMTIDGHPAQAGTGLSGLVLQDPQANTILSRVGDDVAFGCENAGVERAEIWRRVSRSLAAVGLQLPLDRSTEALSGGQRQRLALAGVLAMQPSLLLLDEPTANLDPDGVLEVRDAILRAAEATGATTIVVEHRVATWLSAVDRVVVLEPGGGVIADGRPAAVMAAEGARLAARGVWVPGVPLDVPQRSPRSPGNPLLEAATLVSGRPPTAGSPPVAVHEPITTTVRTRQATVITGPNGAGKSTLGFTVTGLLPPVGGTVTATEALRLGHARSAATASIGTAAPSRVTLAAVGTDQKSHRATTPTTAATLRRVGTAPSAWRARDLATRIGVVFQQPTHQFVTAKVADEIAVGLRAVRTAPSIIDARVEELLGELGLATLAQANPFTLSGGEQRRLSVATVLATAPEVILLDEPTFGQDRLSWQAMLRLLIRLVDDQDRAIVSITHDHDLIERLGDQVIAVAPSEVIH